MSNSLIKKANLTFYQLMVIGLGFFILSLFLAVNLYPQLFLIGESFLGKLKTACGCTVHLTSSSHLFVASLILFLSLGLVTFFGFAVIKIIRLRIATNKFIKLNLEKRKLKNSSRIERAAKIVDLKNQIIEIDEKQLVVFCFGLIKPKICISSGLIKKLSKEELIAVLIHEKHHLLAYEPVKLLLVKIIAKILFFIPGLKLLAKKYLTLSELAADQKATNGFADKVPLARALAKIIKWEEKIILKNNLALSFFSAVTEERVNKLVDNYYFPKFKFLRVKLFVSILIILLVPIFFQALIPQEPVYAETNSCSMMADNNDYQCHLTTEESNCVKSYNLEGHICDN